MKGVARRTRLAETTPPTATPATTVIPAKAGIQVLNCDEPNPMDSHLRGNDEGSGNDEGGQNRKDGGNDEGGGKDRKSTRLNSSHVASSYAVFCLKKKTYTRSYK